MPEDKQVIYSVKGSFSVFRFVNWQEGLNTVCWAHDVNVDESHVRKGWLYHRVWFKISGTRNNLLAAQRKLELL